MCLLPHINVTTKRHVLHGLSGVSSGTELQLSRAVPCWSIQPLQAFFLLCLTSSLLHHASWNHLPNKLLLPKPLPQLLLSGYPNLRQCPYTVYNSLHHWGPASSSNISLYHFPICTLFSRCVDLLSAPFMLSLFQAFAHSILLLLEHSISYSSSDQFLFNPEISA